MLFHTANFTSPALFPFELFPPQSRLSWIFFLEKMRLEMPAKLRVVGSWLCFYATMGFFMLLLVQESVFFMLYRNEQVTMIHFLRHIAREQTEYNNSNIVRSKELWYDIETHQSNFHMLLIARTRTTSIFFMSNCKKSGDD
jgi:hypothetical protein